MQYEIDGEVYMELDDSIYKRICRLIEKGDSYFENDNYFKAVKKYKEALKLVPDPKVDWEASTYIYVAIGEVYYYLSKIEIAIQCYEYAMLCPDGVTNPLIHLRLGQCFYEENKFEKSKEHLFRAYMLEGEEIFADEEEKYYHLIEEEIESVKPTDSMEYDRPDDNIDGPVSGLEPEVEAAVDALIEESNRYYDQKDFHSTREYMMQAWYAMPEDNRYTNNYCYLIADALMSVSLELKDIDGAMKWAEEFKLCELDRIEDGYREMQLGIVYYEGKQYEMAKEYFEIANRNSGGRCFWSEDRKYKEFYKNSLK